jgi:predicted nucleic acid-binding protein
VPAGGSIYLDTSVVIYTVQRNPAYAAALRPLWEAVLAGKNQIVTSELTILECLVAPYRLNDKSLEHDYERFFLTPGLRVLSIDKDVLRRAAMMRAEHPPLKVPDAIHGPTAILAGCISFLTNDHALQNIAGLPVQLLYE